MIQERFLKNFLIIKIAKDSGFHSKFSFLQIWILQNCSTTSNLSRLNFLLVARCLLLSARCSLLFARHFLFITFCSLLVTFCSLLITFCSLLVIFSSKLLNKVTVNYKKWFDYNETPPQIFSLQISEIFVTFSGWWFSKFSQHAKPFSKLT